MKVENLTSGTRVRVTSEARKGVMGRGGHGWAFCLLTLACTDGCARRSVVVSPSSVPVLAQMQRGATVVVHEPGQRPFDIRPEMAPVLTLVARQRCFGVDGSRGSDSCEAEVTAPATRVQTHGDKVVFSSTDPPTCLLPQLVDLDAVEDSALVLGDLRIPLSRGELVRALGYSKTRSLEVRHSTRWIHIGPSSRPLLDLRVRGRPGVEECSTGRCIEPLETLALAGDSIQFCHAEPDIIAKTEDIVRATLYLKNAPPFIPNWGVGVDVAGPALTGSFTVHWYPFENLVLEAGALPVAAVALDSGTFGMWAGSRVRVPADDSLVLSLGASAGLWTYAEDSRSLVGPRAAVELVLPSRRDVLRVEAQYAHGDFVTRSAPRWHPWGGVAYTAWF